MKLTVTINGTGTNPWHKMGLRQNPFPQIAKAELASYMNTLSQLDADPIKDVSQLREILKGWSQEFVELCCAQFKSGERVRFTVTLPQR